MPEPARFDHLVVGIRSLADGVAELARLTGITAQDGGRHPGRGTENALVSLGAGQYFEILAPLPDAPLNARDQPLRGLHRLTIVDWAVAVADVDAAIDTLRTVGIETLAPQPGARVTPAGQRLAWTTFRVADPAMTAAPFFIHWSEATLHPSRTAPAGCSLAALAVRDPRGDVLASALGALGMASECVTTGSRRIEVTLARGAERIRL